MIAWQEPPPYVDYVVEAERLGRASTAAGICKAAGIVEIDLAAGEAEANAFQRRAVIARTWGPVVEAAFHRGMEIEREEFRLMSSIPEGLPASEHGERVDDLVEYLADRCGQLVADYPSMARFPAEE